MFKLKNVCLIASFFAHILILALFLIFSRDELFQKNFIVLGVHSQKPSKAFYKPLHYTVPFSSAGGSKSHGTMKKATRPKKSKQKTSKKIKKPVKKSARVDIKESEKIITIEKKQVNKQKKQKKKKKKQIQQKEKKQEVHKEPQKIKKPEPVREPVLEKEKQEDVSVTSTDQQIVEMITEQNEDEPFHFVFGEFSDTKLREYHECIQKEVSRLWHPPVGVPQGTECSLFFHLDAEGKVKNFEIIQRSKVLIYDLSIMRIAHQIILDHPGLCGKKFTIVFRQ